MAVTYTSFDKNIPTAQRVVLLDSIESGDKIDFVEILGKPATHVQFTLTDPTDEITYRINNKVKRFISVPESEIEDGYTPTQKALFKKEHTYWTTRCSEFSSVGDVFELADGLQVHSLEVTGLTLSTGTTISIVAW